MNESKGADQIQGIAILDATVSLLNAQFAGERSFTELIEPTQVAPWGFGVRLELAPCQTFVCQTFEGQLPLRAAQK